MTATKATTGMKLRNALHLARQAGCEVTEEGVNYHFRHPDCLEAGFARQRRHDSEAQIGLVNYLRRLDRLMKAKNGHPVGGLVSTQIVQPPVKAVKAAKAAEPGGCDEQTRAALANFFEGAQWIYRSRLGHIIDCRALLTPAVAARWIENSMGPNRHLSSLTVDRLKRDMQEGHWRDIGDPIRVDADWRIRDGQHRIWALFDSGTEQWFTVHCGVTEADIAAMDTGRSRTFANVMAMRGDRSYVRETAAVCRLIWAAKRHPTRPINHYADTPSHAELIEIESDYAQRIEALFKVMPPHATTIVPSRSILAYAVLRFSEIDQEAAYKWMHDLIEGANLDPADPVYKLRRYFERGRRMASGRSRTSRLGRDVIYALMVKSWNYRRSGYSPAFMKFSENEDYPVPE
jgi:hypothetical protein